MAIPPDEQPDPSQDGDESGYEDRGNDTGARPELSNADVVRQASAFNAADIVRQASAFNAADIVRQASAFNAADIVRQASAFNAADRADIVRQASVIPDFTKVIRDAIAMPDFTRVLQDAIRVPRIQTQVVAAMRVAHLPKVAGYEDAVRSLFNSLGIDAVPDLRAIDIRPTDDDTVFLAIQEASPEVAETISRAAEIAGNPLLPARVIRNMLAGLLATLIVIAYVGGTVLFFPWGPAVVAILSASGVTAPAAFKFIAPPRQGGPSEDEGSQNSPDETQHR